MTSNDKPFDYETQADPAPKMLNPYARAQVIHDMFKNARNDNGNTDEEVNEEAEANLAAEAK